MQNISIKNIYWMLAYAFRTINEKNIEKLSSEEFDNIYELFAVMMTNELNKQIKRGLNKDYVSIEENTNVLKGKVLVQKTLRTSKKVNKEIVYDKVICEHDDYSVNNYLNQIVKTACIYLIRAKQIKEKKIVDKLKKALLYFDGIDEIDKKSINWNTIKYNKYNSSYRMLINISNLILDGLLINKKDGKIEFRNYIDDQKMHKLYEKFILEYYKYHYANLNPSVPQVEWDVEKNNDLLYLLPKMQTDITLYSNNKTLIIDAKYYRYGDTGIRSHLPPTASISKQITYGEYVKEKEGKDPFNAFLMPYNMKDNPFRLNGEFATIGEAISKWKSNDNKYEHIQGILVDTRFLMHNYENKEDNIIKLAEAIKDSCKKNKHISKHINI